MALYEFSGDGLAPIAQTTFAALGLLERANIQLALRNQIAAITPGVKTMVIAEEFGDWVDVNRRIDLLCIDEDARLVVVELKRDNSAHMELQALRYAAMVSTMRFDQAVVAHGKYLKSIGSDADAEQALREFLEVENGPVTMSSEAVRIVLASSDFSTELTSTVLWLNGLGLDIRCVQMRPHHIEGRVLVDVQQVIPLPAAEQYQVALREKAQELTATQTQIRTRTRDMTRYDLTIGETVHAYLPKRRLIYEIVAEAFRRGMTPPALASLVPWREADMFIEAEGALDEAAFIAAQPGRPVDRFYTANQDLFHYGGKTYAFTSQWGDRTIEAIDNIKVGMKDGLSIQYSPTTPVAEEVKYEDYVVRRRESGTIEVEQGGKTRDSAIKALREIAAKLGVSTLNGREGVMNTRQLGVQVMKAIQAL